MKISFTAPINEEIDAYEAAAVAACIAVVLWG
jgi:hypothetical protein